MKQNFRDVASVLSTAAFERRFNSVLFASPTGGEGTTTTVLSVARMLKNGYGLNPIAIEYNFQRPAFHRFFSSDKARSLSAFASGSISSKECVQTSESGIKYIPAGEASFMGRGAVNGKPLLKRLLDDLDGEFDVALVDVPPLFAQAYAAEADLVVPRLILVVEAGRTEYEVLDRVRHKLDAGGVEIVGAVLNKHRRFIPEWLYQMF